MGNIFSGLESLGLKGADHVEIYAQDEVQKKANQEEKRCISQPVAREPFFHPVASRHFTTSVVK